jgi:hypothetical protein
VDAEKILSEDFSASALRAFGLARTRQSKGHNFCNSLSRNNLKSASQAAAELSGGSRTTSAAIA